MKPVRNEVRLAAPAKINLGLRILGRRSDGYHELDSLFLPLDLADEVRVRVVGESEAVAPGIEFVLRGEPDPAANGLGKAPGVVPTGPDNLVVRAAQAFVEWAGLRQGLHIELTKRIPAAAGLGGGSSDAGAVLRALAEIFPGLLSPGELADLALRIGSDVPYFLDPRPARVTGIGEKIEPCGAPSLSLLLANPGIPVSTGMVFRSWDALADAGGPGPEGNALTKTPSASTMRPPEGLPRSEAELVQSLLNDLEPVATRLCPPIARLREGILACGATGVGMSGSGPTVFGVFETVRAATDALASFSEAAPGRVGGSRAWQKGRVWARVASTLQSP